MIVLLNNADGNFLFRMGENTAVILDPKSARDDRDQAGRHRALQVRLLDQGRLDHAASRTSIPRRRARSRWKATFRFINDPAAQVAALLAGDIDGMPRFGALESLKQFKNDPRFRSRSAAPRARRS